MYVNNREVFFIVVSFFMAGRYATEIEVKEENVAVEAVY